MLVMLTIGTFCRRNDTSTDMRKLLLLDKNVIVSHMKLIGIQFFSKNGICGKRERTLDYGNHITLLGGFGTGISFGIVLHNIPMQKSPPEMLQFYSMSMGS